MDRDAIRFLLSLVIFTSWTQVGAAQQITGVPGSPSATMTIPGNQLPPPPPEFGGVIKESYLDSKPYWPPRVVPPKGAPHVLLIMTDDQGYGVSSTFGGVIPTPALDRIAKAGLRYTQFHSTALCSPTRAAPITGRNHHSAGFGVIGELSTGYPGYDSIIGPENATIGTILRDNGYATSWFGKEHNTPAFQYSTAGPFNQWPVGMGFEYFYGFMGGETDQWKPYLFRNTTQVFPWIGKPEYNLIRDMADDAIRHMRELNAAAPDKPFFVYYVPGGTHLRRRLPICVAGALALTMTTTLVTGAAVARTDRALAHASAHHRGRSCAGLLSVRDFPGAVTAANPSNRMLRGMYVSLCAYSPAANTGPQGGIDQLTTYPNAAAAHAAFAHLKATSQLTAEKLTHVTKMGQPPFQATVTTTADSVFLPPPRGSIGNEAAIDLLELTDTSDGPTSGAHTMYQDQQASGYVRVKKQIFTVTLAGNLNPQVDTTSVEVRPLMVKVGHEL